MSAFPLPIMYVAWGTSPSYDWDGLKTGNLRDLAVASKFKTVAVQLGQVTAGQIDILKAGGLKVAAWNVVGPTNSKIAYDQLAGIDGLIVQVEGFYQYQGALAALDEGIAAGQPKACVTTYAGLENGQWAELAKRGVSDCHVECYKADGHENLDRMLWQGTQYKIPAGSLYAVCGTWQGETPAMYQGLDKLNRDYGCYLGEPMTTDSWKAWGGVNMTTPVYWWVLTTGASSAPTELHAERAVTNPDGTTGLGKMIDWMDTHKDVIRSAKNVDLDHVLR